MRSTNAAVGRILRALAVAGFLWLFLIGVAARGSRTGSLSSHSNKRLHHNDQELDDGKVSTIERGKLHVFAPPKMGINYMVNKRKVPGGPDPIHNRQTSNSKRPPGQC